MSRIADLIIEQGRVAADARQQSGAAWGQAVQNIGAAPGQAIAAYQDKQARDRASALATSRDVREQQGADDSHQQHLAALEQVRQQQLSQWAEKHLVNQSTPEQIAASVDDLPGTWTPQEREGIKARVATDPTTFLKAVAPLREPKPAEPYTMTDANGNQVRFSGDNKEVAKTSGTKTAKTQAELATDAANPASPTQAQSATALDLMRPPKPEPVPRSLDQQLLEAIVRGDTTTVGQLKQTMLTAAQAKRDPDAAAAARSMAGLRADEAKARLDALQEKNKPLDITPDVQTTRSGKTYIDLSQYSVGERDRARKAAADAGATPLSKEQANALQEIDNARANQQSIQDQIGSLLPKGPGGRAVAGVAVPLSKLFQTNDQIAAYNSWRTAAIQTLRATAGSKGLRINQAEIAQAIENDIPKLTDTVGVAQQKLKNINTLLDNAEGSIVVRDRSVTPQPQAAAPTLTPGLAGLAGRK